eukprot:1732127-Heterocapsa_arctica.AAC.1
MPKEPVRVLDVRRLQDDGQASVLDHAEEHREQPGLIDGLQHSEAGPGPRLRHHAPMPRWPPGPAPARWA